MDIEVLSIRLMVSYKQKTARGKTYEPCKKTNLRQRSFGTIQLAILSTFALAATRCVGEIEGAELSLQPLSATTFAANRRSLFDNPELSILRDDLTSTGVLDELVSPYTIFAPTNDAFNQLDQDNLALYRTPNWKEHYRNILFFHVTSGAIEPTSLFDGAGIQMKNEESITLNSSNGTFSLSSMNTFQVNLTQPTELDGNNVIQKIDSVMLPSFYDTDLFSLKGRYEGFDIVFGMIDSIGIGTSFLAGTYTVFLPTDEAFLKLGNETLDYLTASENRIELISLLTNHISSEVIPTDLMVEGSEFPTFGGIVLEIANRDGMITINGVNLGFVNLLANNGIVHAIDTVLTIPDGAPVPPQTINDILGSDPSLERFREVISLVGIDDVFASQDNTFTVFAPTNEAFEAMDQSLLTKLVTPRYSAHLRNLLDFHIVDSSFVPESSLVESLSMTMRNSEIVNTSSTQDNTLLLTSLNNEATIVAADFGLSRLGGVVHKVDSVLLPSYYTRDFPGLEAVFNGYEIIFDFLSRIGDLGRDLLDIEVTVLAPSDDAFLALGSTELKRLINPNNAEDLQQLLASHVFSSVYPMDFFEEGMQLVSLGGLPVNVSISGSTVKFNGANLISPDGLASSGVAHGIDRVLGVSPLDTIENTFLRENDLSSFASAYFDAGMKDTFAGVRGFTAFAPNNDAFEAIDPAFLQRLKSPKWTAHLQNILSFHLTFDDYLEQDLSNDETINMLNGESLGVQANSAGVSVTSASMSAKIVEQDLVVFDGVVQKIDTVLFPDVFKNDFVSTIASIGQFSIFLELAESANLLGIFNTEFVSVLVPTNDAFEAIGQDALMALKDPSNNSELQNLLAYHTLNDIHPSSTLKDGDIVTNVGYYEIAVSVTDDIIAFDNVSTEAKDILFQNGVAYAINEVLLVRTSSSGLNQQDMTSASGFGFHFVCGSVMVVAVTLSFM